MPATPTIIGALLGLGTQMYSNALRKLPYMRRIAPHSPFPLHILFLILVGLGVFVGLRCSRCGIILDLDSANSGLRLDPWEHVLGMGLGAVFVNQLVKWDDKLKQDLDKMLERAKQANERRYFEAFKDHFS
ncbi:hypothetical protein PR202_ga25207 [Eleusine coracana subsp. coracana]|uniref:Uncharacterized protein n=1 Tax=Eleusine coracana subsp. coracana TaxID=191504 RepID=A0AAV5DAF0_ELECO|nr:hypothetical protein PR202_ga25207 [Eleusine coracana subsp. coracana]